jgi:hypothetical protein
LNFDRYPLQAPGIRPISMRCGQYCSTFVFGTDIAIVFQLRENWIPVRLNVGLSADCQLGLAPIHLGKILD